jgi:hypothetical protein
MKRTGLTALLASMILFTFAIGALAAGPVPLQIKIVSPTIAPGWFTSISFTGGTPPYTLTSSRADVASLSCNQPLTYCNATGKAAGITALIVKDSKGVTSRADLTVAKPAPMPSVPPSASFQQTNNAAQQAQQEQLQKMAEQRKNAEIQQKTVNPMKDAVQKIDTPAKKTSPWDQYVR